MKLLAHLFVLTRRIQSRLEWFPLLLARFVAGWIFLWSGWGKLHNLEDVISFFNDLGIPAANIQAPMIATLELVGGAFLLAGLGTRFFSFLLSCTMAVALITAKREDIGSLGDLFGLSEFLYIVMFITLIVRGAGSFSLDTLLERQIRKQGDITES